MLDRKQGSFRELYSIVISMCGLSGSPPLIESIFCCGECGLRAGSAVQALTATTAGNSGSQAEAPAVILSELWSGGVEWWSGRISI